MKCRVLAVVTVGLLVAADAPNEKPRPERDRLQGTWVLVAVEVAGERLEVPLEARQKRVVISAERIDTYWMNTCECGTYKLAPAEKGIDIVSSGRGREKAPPLKCLYRIDGDSLTFAVNGFHEEERPSGFETTPRNSVVVQIYKRTEPGETKIPGVEEEQKKLEGTWQVVSVIEADRKFRPVLASVDSQAKPSPRFWMEERQGAVTTFWTRAPNRNTGPLVKTETSPLRAFTS